MVTIWGLRLTVHIGRRSIGKGEDPRYEQLLTKGHGNPTVNALVKVYLPQAVLALRQRRGARHHRCARVGVGTVLRRCR